MTSDRIGGRMQALQALRFTVSHHPGGNPNPTLPEEHERLYREMPKEPASPLERLAVPVIDKAGLTRGIPMDGAEQFQHYVHGLLGSDNEAVLRQQVMQYAVEHGYDPDVRRALMYRAMSYYKSKGYSAGNGERVRTVARGATPDGKSMKVDLQRSERFVLDLFKADGGPFIGPKGGKWADAKHTVSWTERQANSALSDIQDVQKINNAVSSFYGAPPATPFVEKSMRKSVASAAGVQAIRSLLA